MLTRLVRLPRTIAGLAVLIGLGTIGLVLNVTAPRRGILTDLPEDPAEARATFDARVRARIAPGMRLDTALAQMIDAGFRVDPARAIAVREERRGPVRRVWRIMWDASGSTITAIRPTMGVSAL